MAPENYYLVLGVSRSESSAGIRARYRDLARALHPDVAGAQSTSAFQKIAEAYAVLADPLTRERHDAALAAWEGRDLVRVREDAITREPWEPVSLLRDPLAIPPSFVALIDRLFRDFTGSEIPNADRPEGLTFEVTLTPDEARQGVDVPIAVPCMVRCRKCAGIGDVWLGPCSSCGGQGFMSSKDVVRIPIPPGVRSASVVQMSLRGLGTHSVYLRLYVRVQE